MEEWRYSSTHYQPRP